MEIKCIFGIKLAERVSKTYKSKELRLFIITAVVTVWLTVNFPTFTACMLRSTTAQHIIHFFILFFSLAPWCHGAMVMLMTWCFRQVPTRIWVIFYTKQQTALLSALTLKQPIRKLKEIQEFNNSLPAPDPWWSLCLFSLGRLIVRIKLSTLGRNSRTAKRCCLRVLNIEHRADLHVLPISSSSPLVAPRLSCVSHNKRSRISH